LVGTFLYDLPFGKGQSLEAPAAWLRAIVGGWQVGGEVIWQTGFPRKLVLVLAIMTLFSGGIAKLMNAGPAWMDGHSLQFYIQNHSQPRWPWLSNLLRDNLAACAALSVLTILFELTTPLALFFRAARNVILVLAIGFHVGIWLILAPNYWTQIWCYVLLLDFSRIRGRLALLGIKARRPVQSLSESVGAPTTPADRTNLLSTGLAKSTLVGVCGGYVFCFFLVLGIILRVEWWPFTYIPMYSAYHSPQSDVLRDAEHLQRLARESLAQNNYASVFLGDRLSLRFVPVDGSEPVPISKVTINREAVRVAPSQSAKAIVFALALALAQRPLGQIHAYDDERDPAQKLLRRMVPWFKRVVRDWERYERIEVVCHLNSGLTVIASTTLSR
jgi:hypothetical protein